MPQKIKYIRTLLYYDGPIIILAENVIGTKYVCLLTKRDNDFDAYLCVLISDQRLNSLIFGDIDTNSVFTNPEISDYYILKIDDYINKEYEVVILNKSEVNPQWFPLENTFLPYFPSEIKSEIISREAIEQNTAIIHLSFNPPEAQRHTSISTQLLVKGLNLYQGILRATYRNTLKLLPREKRKTLDAPEYYQTDIIGFSPGSFNVHLRSKTFKDLFEEVDICRALRLLDEIIENVDNPNETMKILKEHKGHVVNTYRNILEFVINNNTPIEYSWTIPNSKVIHNHFIPKRQAQIIYEKINTVKELNIEHITVIGEFTKIDWEKNQWTIMDEDGKHYSGNMSPEANINLKGATAGFQKYSFVLEEIIEESEITAKEKYIYKLIDYKRIQ